ncbi:gamma-glutamyltransferase [Veronia pacifica]|uniref:Glutathione hydrolase proenzyme n=1 Tax=Veronia pacifica TaxID=1080227 RepID=A0A1C3EJM0_9GAMM|nr:gamma-glutamyltransferase [Veronia pacifica]ODA33432.1 gamma-glutamyltransferase [Veronia pacifica]
MKPITSFFLTSNILLGLTFTQPAFCEQVTDAIAPELATGTQQVSEVTGKKWMVSAANPYASRAGAAILDAGGNAIDAMVTVQTVLGLVEPQSSGIGGGALLVYWDNKANRLTTFDGRETAPLAATPRLFQLDDGNKMRFYDAVVGGRSVGVPGTLKLLHDTHKKYGKLSWEQVLEPAISLAEKGFIVSPRLAKLVAGDAEKLKRFESTAAYFFDTDGAPLKAGDMKKNPDYAQTLKLVSENIDHFYQGKIADDIVKTVQQAPGNPGVLSKEDMSIYRVKEREPVCSAYHSYQVCGMGPPTSGGITVGQILGMLSHYPLSSMGKDAVQSWRLIGDASRLAFSDRGRYVADSDFVPVPVEGLLAPEYLKQRASLLEGENALSSVSPGEPAFSHAIRLADDDALELPSTSHFSIVDPDGNLVSITTTIENGFGSRLMVRGFLLNNELTDFSFSSHKNGVPIANRVEPGKRPRSSMSPTIVMHEGKPYLAIGSPGGSRIIGYVAKTLIAHLDWGLGIQQAIELPHLVNRFGTYDLEKGSTAESFKAPLEALGFKVNIRDLTSGIHAILIEKNGLRGGADPRREGIVLSDTSK